MTPSLERLAQYELGPQVGAGAMGVVHRARDVDLDRPVALKLLRPELARGPDTGLVEWLLREASAAAQLIHPNVGLIYQVGRHEALTFIAMEWLDGGDLAQAVQRLGALPWRDAVAAARGAAAGLAAAHAIGLVHRDVKPSNLMCNRAGEVKLVDFGLARWHDQPSDLTVGGSILGTPAYLSPEQWRGEPATPLSDQYALGCTLFHLLTGQSPFAAPNLVAVMHGHLNKPLPDMRRFAGDVPEAVDRLLQRATAKRPADRFADAAALHAALHAALLTCAQVGAVAADDDPTVIVNAQRPTAAGAEPAAGNLPLSNTSFIGRATETSQLPTLLAQARWVTLTGPGGSGKTRLALQVASDLADRYADGAWLVELAALAPALTSQDESWDAVVAAGTAGTPSEAVDGVAGAVAGAVAAVLGVREAAGQDVTEALVWHLRPRKLLLVLDNAEHVVDAAAALAVRLVAACPDLHLIVTSRQLLSCPGEVGLPVPPLATVGDRGDGIGNDRADPGADVSADPAATLAGLAQVEAVRLFVDRARAARPAFDLDADNAAAVAQICHRLDGIPLAIELAAARIKVLSPAQIAQRLDNAFQLLTGGQRTLLPRQQTLRALIDWSWDLLDDAQRRLLAKASVFNGDFSLEAAEAVLPTEGGLVVLDGLAGLVDHSLLVATERGGRMRYRLLETMRQYAGERLAALGSRLSVQRRHAEHFAAELAASVQRLHSAEHALALAHCRAERANATAALDMAIEQRWLDVGLRLGADLGRYWLVEGVLADGLARLDHLLALQPPPGADLAALLSSAGVLSMYLGRHAQARQYFDAGLAMARSRDCAASDAPGLLALEGRILNCLGFMARSAGDLAQAQAHVGAALAAWREVGDRLQEAHTLNNLAAVVHDLGQVDSARQHLQHALALLREAGGKRGIAYASLSLGDLEQDDGRPDRAQALYETGLALLSELGDTWGMAQARGGLGQCALERGDLAQARRQLEQALAVTRQLGDRAAVAQHLDRLARLALLEGSPEHAIALAQESLQLRLDTGNRVDLAASLETQAAVCATAQPERSAMLLGCARAWRDALQMHLPAARRPLLQALHGALQDRLGPQRLASALAAGERSDALQVARGLVLS